MQEILDRLQHLQTELDDIRRPLDGNSPKFWALYLAWECTRIAWYAMRGDNADALNKLDRIDYTIEELTRMLKAKV